MGKTLKDAIKELTPEEKAKIYGMLKGKLDMPKDILFCEQLKEIRALNVDYEKVKDDLFALCDDALKNYYQCKGNSTQKRNYRSGYVPSEKQEVYSNLLNGFIGVLKQYLSEPEGTNV